TWATFTPCFLWIFLGAPYIERLRENEKLRGALSTVTAAVLGVILNLAVWFGLHVIFPPGRAVDWFAVAICALAFIGDAEVALGRCARCDRQLSRRFGLPAGGRPLT
ncbi:MAG: chromate transporter, partial [Chthoniobacterales bacterium]